MGHLIEFPRKLEWQTVESWVGRVPNTHLTAKVERVPSGSVFSWYAWNGHVLVSMGTAPSLEAGQEAAKHAFESGTLVVRSLGNEPP